MRIKSLIPVLVVSFVVVLAFSAAIPSAYSQEDAQADSAMTETEKEETAVVEKSDDGAYEYEREYVFVPLPVDPELREARENRALRDSSQNMDGSRHALGAVVPEKRDRVAAESDSEVKAVLHGTDQWWTNMKDPYGINDGVDIREEYIEKLPNTVSDSLDKNRIRARKLSRGVSNFFLCWMEVPHQITNSIEDSDLGTGLIVGSITGVVYTVTRAMVGAFEIVTFWSPHPGDYDVIMEPEFLIHETWGDGVPPFTVESPAQENMMTGW